MRTKLIKRWRNWRGAQIIARAIRVISLCFTPKTGVQVLHTELSSLYCKRPPLRWNFPEGAMDADGAGAGAGGAGAGAGGAGAGGSGSAGKNSWPLIACTAQNLISLPHHNCLLQKLINFKPPPRHRPHQKSIIRGRWYTICLLALLAKHRSGFKFSYKVPNNV